MTNDSTLNALHPGTPLSAATWQILLPGSEVLLLRSLLTGEGRSRQHLEKFMSSIAFGQIISYILPRGKDERLFVCNTFFC